MLALFYGTDRKAVRDAGKKYTDTVDGVVTVIEASSYTPGQVTANVGAVSLFGGVECFVLDTPSSEEEFGNEILASLKEMADSQNVFVVLEGKLLADSKKKYAKYASTIEEYTAEKEEPFNAFQIAEALASKDKKQLWVLLQQAKARNIRDEETIGILWWQLKALRLARLTRNAEDAGMKEYPYKKATQSLRNFKEGEVGQLSRSLLELYHDAHQGKRDMDVALEQWALSV